VDSAVGGACASSVASLASIASKDASVGAAGVADQRYYPFWIWIQASPSLPNDDDAMFVLFASYTENVV